MAGPGRRMPPNDLRRVDRTNKVLHSEGMDGSERIFTVPVVLDEFRIEVHGTAVFHIGIQAFHSFSLTETFQRNFRKLPESESCFRLCQQFLNGCMEL